MDFHPVNEVTAGSNNGRGAKEVLPRIDFQERHEPPQTSGKGRGVQVKAGMKFRITNAT